MRKPNLSKLASIGCSVALAASMCAPAAAFADDGAAVTAGSTVTLQYVQTLTGDEGVPTEDIIGVTMPSTIPFAYRTDGTVVAPTSDVYKITNKSIRDIYIDSNAVWAIGNGELGEGAGKAKIAVNGASRATDANVDLTLNLRFKDKDRENERTTATTYDPTATVTDGKTALEAGHPEVDGSALSANNLKIEYAKDLGIDFFASIAEVGENADGALSDFFDYEAFKQGATQFGTLTWTFNTQA